MKLWLAAAVSLMHSPTIAADTTVTVDDNAFAQCTATLLAEARESGIGAATLDAVTPTIRLNENVLRLDAAQPEFTNTFAGYYPVRVTAQRVRRGRELLATHQDILQRIQRETGVPPHYLLSFWGLETNFGSFLGNYHVPSVLATLACHSRRNDYFRGEFIHALEIIDRGDITSAAMLGSWAGAMGNMQFMPTAYLNHAADGDGDGHRNLWTSTADALVSAGRFLQALGWQTGMRWGREVLLPEGFDYRLLDQIRPLAFWVDQGIRDSAGRALTGSQTPARILAPSGHAGPAFIVYPNFDVIMRWNRSEYYAISVGRLADEIAGGGRLLRRPPAEPTRIPLATVRNLQNNLTSLGYDTGKVDGIIGPGTRQALTAWQYANGLLPDGYASAELLARLGDTLPPTAADLSPSEVTADPAVVAP